MCTPASINTRHCTPRAAECAGNQGAFEAYHDLLFVHAESLSVQSFATIARDTKVPDLKLFAACAAAAEDVPGIERDIRAARDVGGWGTPTVIVNGIRLIGGPRFEVLDSVVRAELRKTR